MENIQSLTKKGSLYLPENISATLSQFDLLFYVIFWLSGALLVGLLLFGFFFIISGKRQHKDQLATKQITHNVKLEVIWTVIPTLIVMIIFVWGFKEYLVMRTVQPNALEVYVTGKKWFWEFYTQMEKLSMNWLYQQINQLN